MRKVRLISMKRAISSQRDLLNRYKFRTIAVKLRLKISQSIKVFVFDDAMNII